METYTYKLVEDEHGNIQCGDKLYRFEETIEEEKKITKKDFEQLGYALGSIQKCISKGYNKALEEHKIPEKLELKDNWCRKKGDYIITDYEINPLILNKINEIIDYLKSKGE